MKHDADSISIRLYGQKEKMSKGIKTSDMWQNIMKHLVSVYPVGLIDVFKSQSVKEVVNEIMNASEKGLAESVLILLAVFRYIYQFGTAEDFMDTKNVKTFSKFVKGIKSTDAFVSCIERKVQGSIPSRGFPVADVLSKFFPAIKTFSVLELGAAGGSIGKLLLSLSNITCDYMSMFPENQMVPTNIEVQAYRGVDIDPINDHRWAIACMPTRASVDIMHLVQTMDHGSKSFELVQGDILNLTKSKFSKIFSLPTKVKGTYHVLLTSYVLYQFDADSRKRAIKGIMEFCDDRNYVWINQDVNLQAQEDRDRFFIALNGEIVLRNFDERGSRWEYINT